MRYGRRVLGEQKFQEDQRRFQEAQQRGFRLGRRVTGSSPSPAATQANAPEQQQAAPVPEPEGAEPEAAVVQAREPVHILSLKELEKALKANSSEQLLDELLAAEFKRPEGQPRRGALRLLLEAEKARGPNVRKAVLSELEKALQEE